VPYAGPDAITPEQRWGTASADQPAVAPAYAPAYQPPPPAPTLPTHFVAPQPRNPRKRGPQLFWFTMALSALAVGVVGIVDTAGASVAGSTYPAVVVGVIGVMLLVGAFYGRAGGLILVGLVASLVTGVGLASEKVDTERTVIAPATSAAVADRYSFDTGEQVLDLSMLTDPEALDGRTLHLTGSVGELDVVVPADMDVTVNASVNGPGGVTLFGEDSGGIDTSQTRVHDGGTGVPRLTLDVTLDVGHIDIRTR
jgi:hypothetical protein